MIAAVDHLGVKQAVLVGNALGGNVAWRVAVDHPERVSRSILVDTSGYPTAARSMPIGFGLAQIPAVQAFLAD